MFTVRLTALALCLLVPAVSRAADGGVHLYLQPVSADAARLTFAIASVSAVAASGAEYPLDLRLPEVGLAEAGRQRLLASGRVPAGSYSGFSVKVKQARLKSEHGEVALVVPDRPVTLAMPFAVAGREASLFWLTFRYDDSIPDDVSFNPVFTVAVPPRPMADRAGFVASSRANTITVFDKQIGQAVGVIETCAGAAGMALDQFGRRLYVACERDGEIQAIDVVSNEVVERTRLFPGDGAREIALTPDGATLVSANAGSDSISFLDASPLVRRERLGVGSGPGSVVIDASGRRAFVFNTLSSSISVVDIVSRSVLATIATDASPLRGQFSPRGDRLYVIHERSPYVTVLDPTHLTLVTRARLRAGIDAIKVDTRRNLLYIGGRNDTMVEFYDPNALVPIDTMRTRGGVAHLAIDAEQNRLYVVSPDRRSLVIGSLADRKVVSEIDVGEAPYWVAVMGER